MTLFVVTGMSGCGKTSTMRSISQAEVVSHTTRGKRKGERDMLDYHFIDEEKFADMLMNNEFIEHISYDYYNYGISKAEVDFIMKEHGYGYIIATQEGFEQIKESYPDVVGIFIYASKDDCAYNMMKRGDALEDVVRRAEMYEDALEDRHDYDYVLKNVRNKQGELEQIIRNIIMMHADVELD